jgi:hypothetical protein
MDKSGQSIKINGELQHAKCRNSPRKSYGAAVVVSNKKTKHAIQMNGL